MIITQQHLLSSGCDQVTTLYVQLLRLLLNQPYREGSISRECK